jgi:hypothetical protein
VAESSAIEVRFDAAQGDRRYGCGETAPAGLGDIVPVRLQASGVLGCVATILGPAAPLGFGAG